MRLAMAGVLILSSIAVAQPMVPGGGMQRPTVSPYINLARGSGGINNAALNYYGIVRPEQAFRQQASNLQHQLSQTNQNLNTLEANAPNPMTAVTGRGATFNNLGGYFNSYGGGAGANMSGSSFAGRGSSPGGGVSIGIGVNNGGGGGRGGARPSSGGGRR